MLKFACEYKVIPIGDKGMCMSSRKNTRPASLTGLWWLRSNKSEWKSDLVVMFLGAHPAVLNGNSACVFVFKWSTVHKTPPPAARLDSNRWAGGGDNTMSVGNTQHHRELAWRFKVIAAKLDFCLKTFSGTFTRCAVTLSRCLSIYFWLKLYINRTFWFNMLLEIKLAIQGAIIGLLSWS